MDYIYSDRIKDLGGNAIREIFKLLQDPEVISFAGGFPTKSTLPTNLISDITAELMNSDKAQDILQYGGTEGYTPLRESAVEYVKRYGIEGIDIDNTLIISGGQQGIDLTFKTFVNKGDVVLVEDPTYLASLHILKTYQGKAIGVKSGDNGLDIEDLEAKIKQYNPKVLYIVPTFSNPTGRTYSVENRKAIAELTAKYNVMVLEDDPYSELRFSGERVPSIKSFDKAGNVVYITSFSKTLAPGLRTGVAIGAKEVIRKYTIGKQATDVHTCLLSQAIIDNFLRKNLMDERLEELKAVYLEKKTAMLNAIKKYMPKEFKHTNPDGGLFIFGEFDEKYGINTLELFPELVKQYKVAYVSGHSFFASEDKFNTLRLNYSNASLEQIDDGVRKMGEFFKKVLTDKGFKLE